MALGDWDFFETGGATEGIQTVGPILGAGSLEVNTASSDNWHGQRNSGFSRGFTKGKIRSILRWDVATGTIGSGLFCMSDQETLLNASADLYAAELFPGVSVNNINLYHYQTGIDVGSGTLLGQAQVNFAIGATMPIELEWNLDLVGLGGILLIVRTGNSGDLDYTNLTQKVIHTDFTPLTTAFAEGIYSTSGGSGNQTVLFDTTEIFSGA